MATLTNVIPGKPSMKSPLKGKSRYQLKIEANDPNAVTLLRQKAMRALGTAVDRGDVRAITFILEHTNALKQGQHSFDVSSLAGLLAPARPTEAATKGPPVDLAISIPTQNFPSSGPQVADSTEFNNESGVVNADIEVED
jgi:hypothetical protein